MMWRLIALTAVAVRLLFFASPAAASRAARAPTADNAARAVAIAYGTVTEASAGAVTLQVSRVLQGKLGSTVRLFVGPGRGGVAGTAVGTSVDYGPEVGTDHVLYLVRGADGQLETNACIGSHAGPPDASEVTFFGPAAPSGAPSVAPTPTGGPVVAAPSVIAPATSGALLVVIIVIGVATLLTLRIRTARRRPYRGEEP